MAIDAIKDVILGNWKQISGHAKKHWGKLTEDDLAKVNGNAEEFVGLLQEKYGIGKREAEKKINTFLEENKDEFENFLSKARRAVQEFSESLSDNAQYVKDHAYRAKDQMTENFQDYSGQLEDCIVRAPIKSVAIAAGIGILIGALFFK